MMKQRYFFWVEAKKYNSEVSVMLEANSFQATAASIFSRSFSDAMEVLEADDICLPRGVRCALSAIQVRGQRDQVWQPRGAQGLVILWQRWTVQDVALLLDDEALFFTELLEAGVGNCWIAVVAVPLR